MKAKINDIYRIVEDSFTACEVERLISELEVLLEIKEKGRVRIVRHIFFLSHPWTHFLLIHMSHQSHFWIHIVTRRQEQIPNPFISYTRLEYWTQKDWKENAYSLTLHRRKLRTAQREAQKNDDEQSKPGKTLQAMTVWNYNTNAIEILELVPQRCKINPWHFKRAS